MGIVAHDTRGVSTTWPSLACMRLIVMTLTYGQFRGVFILEKAYKNKTLPLDLGAIPEDSFAAFSCSLSSLSTQQNYRTCKL